MESSRNSGIAPVLGYDTDQFVSPINYLQTGGTYTSGNHQTLPLANENFFQGALDEMKIYSRALSAADISIDMIMHATHSRDGG